MAVSTDEYQGLKNEDAVRLYLREEKKMNQLDIDDFMRVYSTLSIEEISELLFEMIGKEIYRTYPPDMKTFIYDPYFLGTIYGDSIFPVWSSLLPEIYPAPMCKAYEEIILSTATRCFGKGTQMLMYDGTIKNVEDIKVGDVLMGDDSTPRNVLRTVTGEDDMYKITPNNYGESYTVNKNHTMVLKHLCNYDKDTKIVEISVKDYIDRYGCEPNKRWHLFKPEEPLTFNGSYTPKLDPYYIGLWLADGRKDSTAISVNKEDTVIETYLSDYYNSLGLLTSYGNIQVNSKDIKGVSKDRKYNYIKTCLKDMNLFNNKHVPFNFKYMSVEDRLRFLAGYIDGDGYLTGRNWSTFQIETSNEKIRDGILSIADSLGFRTHKRYRERYDKRTNKTYISYCGSIGGNTKQIPTKIERKKARSSTYSNQCRFKIEHIGQGKFYGFTTDGNNRILHHDCIVDHNCGKSTSIAIAFAYEIMLLLCMISPAKTILGKASGSLVMGILSKDNQTAVGQVATDLYKILTLSPYFQSIIEGDLAFSNIEKKGVAITDSVLLKAGSSLATIVGTDLFACCLDEANIGTTKIAAEKLVETRLQLWQHAIDRRNATLDKAPAGTGIMFITSSPTEENDVIKARIDQVQNNDIPNVKIVDNLSRWEARGTHATETFDFFIGSDTKDPCLLEDVPDLILSPDELVNRVIKVPRTQEFLTSFRTEPIRAIQEIAGLRTAPENAFFRSVAPFEKVFYKENDIFTKDEMHLTLNGYLDFDDYMIDKQYFSHPHDPECFRYIHLDIASKQDRFGLASVYSKRMKFKSDDGVEISKRMYFVDFCLGLKAQGGDSVDLLKALDFLYKIKKQGYPIKIITTDSHQGELAQQYLQRATNKTVNTDFQSVEKSKDAYFNLKNLILTESLIGYKNPYLTKELKNLREDERRVQKPKGDGYSDDMSDALAGALFTCSQDKYYMKTDGAVTDIINQFKQQQNWGQMYGRTSYDFRPFNK